MRRLPQFVYLAGCDGTGKTTHVEGIMRVLQSRGVPALRRWLRFPFRISIPLLLYARLRGLSWFEVHNSVRYGYWDFRHSWVLRYVLPWTILIDAMLTALVYVYWPLLRGRTLVCDRFTLDMLVDLMVATGRSDLHNQLVGRLLARLIPRNAAITILDLDAQVIRQRRPDLHHDRRLEEKLAAYRRLAHDFGIRMIQNDSSIEQTARQIYGAHGMIV